MVLMGDIPAGGMERHLALETLEAEQLDEDAGNEAVPLRLPDAYQQGAQAAEP